MAHSVVTATDLADLFGELEVFAEAQGWVVEWNTGSQIGLRSGNCYAALGTDGTTNPATETDTYPDPDVNVSDFRIYGSLGKDFAGHASHYWGLTGSLVTSATDVDRVMMNDINFPISEVQFFGDSTYIWVLIRSAADRYTHFGFGNLDKKGMTHPDCAFMCSIFWRWWDNVQVNGIERKRNMDYASGDFGNKMWFKDGYGNYQIYVPDGVLDPAYGIADDVISRIGLSNCPDLDKEFQPPFGATDFSNARLMDHWSFARAKPLTGGLPLLSFPVLFGDGTAASLLCFLGDIPGIRLCDIGSVAIGEDIIYGSETFVPFPVKRRSTSTYDGRAGSWWAGVAFKKD